MDQDVGVFHLAVHLIGVGDEIGRGVAAVEKHAFDDVELGFQALGFLDRDHAFIADLLHGFGDHFADFGVAVGGNGPDLGNLGAGGNRLRRLFQRFDNRFDGDVDATLEVHGVHAGGH